MPLPLLLMATAVLLLVEVPRPGGLSLLPLLPLLLLALLSTPVVGRWLHRLACAPERLSGLLVPPDADPPTAVDVVVVLSGGFPDRDLRGLTLLRRGAAPLLLFSGYSSAGTTARRRQLLSLAGVSPDRVLFETDSRSTGEGGRAFAALAARRHWRSALLVTDATHLARALGHYRLEGGQVLAAPCGDPGRLSAAARRARPAHRQLLDLVPNVDGLATSTMAWRELLGRLLLPP